MVDFRGKKGVCQVEKQMPENARKYGRIFRIHSSLFLFENFENFTFPFFPAESEKVGVGRIPLSFFQ